MSESDNKSCWPAHRIIWWLREEKPSVDLHKRIMRSAAATLERQEQEIHQLTDKAASFEVSLDAAIVKIKRQSQQIEELVERLNSVSDLVPTNWLDPLLSGKDAVVSSPINGLQVEELLRQIKARIKEHTATAKE